jgi:hypothetical protein
MYGGVSLAIYKHSHFGAFLDAGWRRNDILYGRLDAAECLISTLLPDEHPRAVELLRGRSEPSP